MPSAQNRIAIVTGSSSGLGLLSAVALAQAGYTVASTMRDLSRQTPLVEAAAAAGVAERVVVRACDVTVPQQVTAMVAGVVADFARIDLLLNNAGFAQAGFLEDLTIDELRAQFETNFFGQVSVTKAVLPVMRRQHSGKILMMSSASGIRAVPVVGAYASSKWALEGWSEALRMECLPLGIYVSLIEPGSHDSDIWTRNSRVAAAAYGSPNAPRSKRFQELVQSHHKEDPAAVADTVVKIALDPAPTLRYPVGKMVWAAKWITLLLPWKRYEQILIRRLGLSEAKNGAPSPGRSA